jgi:hypothetical protein
MKKILIIALILLTSIVNAQRFITVFMQDYELENSSLYWDTKYGLKNFITSDWKELKPQHYYNIKENVFLNIKLYNYDKWMHVTEFIDKIVVRDDSTLYILVGHNQLFGESEAPVESHTYCSDNILFGCRTNDVTWWCIDNTIVNTFDLIAPERYIVWPAIVGWVRGYDEKTIRNRVSQKYSKYQKIAEREAELIFGGSMYCN